MTTQRGLSSGGYRKLTEMMQTWHEMAKRSRYEQCWLAKLSCQQLTTVYGRQAVMTSTLITGGI